MTDFSSDEPQAPSIIKEPRERWVVIHTEAWHAPWVVTNGYRRFRCDSLQDADWVAELLGVCEAMCDAVLFDDAKGEP